MSGVTVTVSWNIKPKSIDAFVATLQDMFKITRLRPGFRNIRLLRGDIEKSQFILVEEWDTAQNFYDYMQFRADRGEIEGFLAMITEQPQIGIWNSNPLAHAQA
ncbi:putative quinol monooxygenase [Bradyrhizobium genosp. P]|uniref:putative quinol monooxygenase n=1 Tax=Bradyrhizobium genosp. P TaxID=83641 RepID=UPI003CE826E5